MYHVAVSLNFQSLTVTIRTTRYNMLITLHLCILCGCQKKQYLLPYTPLADWFYNRSGECLLCGTH